MVGRSGNDHFSLFRGEQNAWEKSLSMSMTLVTTFLLSATLTNIDADALPYYDPPSPWIPSYSYAFKGASSILPERGEKLLLMNAEIPVYRTYHVIALVSGRDRVGTAYFRYHTKKIDDR